MTFTGRLQTIVAILLVLMLSACEQPEPAQESSAEQPAAAAGSSGGVGSVDANGNIAPFGFASREPVEMAAQPAEQAPASAATSELFAVHCAACHGADANGVEGLGVSLVASTYVGGSNEAQLVAFLQQGRPLDAPDNTTGVPMPAFGWMEAGQLDELATHLKSLQP